MLITWGATGRPHYPTEGGNIPEISDVGASYLKPLFVTGCSITAVGFVLCLLAERVLRNHGRLDTLTMCATTALLMRSL
jgi:hypothetical protein